MHHCYFFTDCKQTEKGTEFRGTISVTRSGKQCQEWFTQTPHSHNFNNTSLFPDRRAVEVSEKLIKVTFFRCPLPPKTNPSTMRYQMGRVPFSEKFNENVKHLSIVTVGSATILIVLPSHSFQRKTLDGIYIYDNLFSLLDQDGKFSIKTRFPQPFLVRERMH